MSSGQAIQFLYRAADSGADRIPDLPLHAGQPGECDSSLHLSGNVYWNPGLAPGHGLIHPEDQ